MWRDKIKSVTLTQFRANVSLIEPNLSKLGEQAKTLRFTTAYLCEVDFSTLIIVKSKTVQRLIKRGYQICINNHNF